MKDEPRPRLRLVGLNDTNALTTKVVSEQTLEKVLGYLQENDLLFDYNVPKDMRDPTRKYLQEFLIKTYTPRNFEITGEDAVKKYLKLYDFVEYCSENPTFKYNFYLKPGMKGVITAIDLSKDYPLAALWEPCNEFPKEQKLYHEGMDMSLLSKRLFQKKKITSRIELLAQAEVGMLLEPTSIHFKYLYYVPTGNRGIVTKIGSSKEYPVEIIFGNIEGYIPPDNGILASQYNGLKLFRENKIDIEKLINEL